MIDESQASYRRDLAERNALLGSRSQSLAPTSENPKIAALEARIEELSKEIGRTVEALVELRKTFPGQLVSVHEANPFVVAQGRSDKCRAEEKKMRDAARSSYQVD